MRTERTAHLDDAEGNLSLQRSEALYVLLLQLVRVCLGLQRQRCIIALAASAPLASTRIPLNLNRMYSEKKSSLPQKAMRSSKSQADCVRHYQRIVISCGRPWP